MNSADFKIWWKHHVTSFTACAGWLSRFPVTARSEADVTQRDIMDAWDKILAFTDLDDAIAATDALASGSESFSDKAGFDCHPRDVRRIAMQARGERHREKNADRLKKIIDGQETVACVLCSDDGLRFCIHPDSVAAFAQGTLRHRVNNPDGGRPFYTTTRACKCQAGDRYAEMLGRLKGSDLEMVWDAADDWWPHVEAFTGKLHVANESEAGGW